MWWRVSDIRSCSFVKFQTLIVMLEQFKCDELTRAPCRSLPKIDVFDHFFKVKVAEIFWGSPAHLPLPFRGGGFTPDPPPPPPSF